MKEMVSCLCGARHFEMPERLDWLDRKKKSFVQLSEGSREVKQQLGLSIVRY
jgi:hypothetical protein